MGTARQWADKKWWYLHRFAGDSGDEEMNFSYRRYEIIILFFLSHTHTRTHIYSGHMALFNIVMYRARQYFQAVDHIW